MRYGVVGVHYPPPPPPPPPNPSPSPSPPLTAAAAVHSQSHHSMIFSVFLALFLPCAGMSAVFVVYICLLWYASNNTRLANYAVKPAEVKGLSATELEKLPKITGNELVLGTECAVCLDEIESDQPARVVPGCNHGFHLQCADTWLSNHPVCPVCRTKLDSQFFDALDNPC